MLLLALTYGSILNFILNNLNKISDCQFNMHTFKFVQAHASDLLNLGRKMSYWALPLALGGFTIALIFEE